MVNKKVLFISHDATTTGAPIVLLHLLRWLKLNSNIELSTLLLDGGDLVSEFKSISPVYILNPQKKESTFLLGILKKVKHILFKTQKLKKFPKHLTKEKFDLIYANTVASTPVLQKLKELFNCPIILHVHENEYTIKNFYPQSLNNNITKYINYYIAVSKSTKENLILNYQIPSEKIYLVNEFISINNIKETTKIKEDLKIELGTDKEFIIGGAGITSWRKGVDLFLQVAAKLNRTDTKSFKFVWVGKILPEFQIQLDYELQRLGLDERIITFTNQVNNPQDYFQIFDIFFLSSREDPFPLVCLEVASLGKPIICFDNSGGMLEFINQSNGEVIQYGNIDDVTQKIIDLSLNKSLLEKKGSQVKKDVSNFDVNLQAPKIYNILEQQLKNA
jgi:glycosyltransferase involved in cell wall biosynthesis